MANKLKTQLLGGFLIALSLSLLFCWYQKQNTEYFTAYDDPNLKNKLLEGMHGGYTEEQKSMNELENGIREPLVSNGLPDDPNDMRWQSSTMQTVDTTNLFDGDYDSERAHAINLVGFENPTQNSQNEPIGSDIITPNKPVGRRTGNPHSYEQLVLMDNAMNYGTKGTIYSAPRPNSDITL